MVISSITSETLVLILFFLCPTISSSAELDYYLRSPSALSEYDYSRARSTAISSSSVPRPRTDSPHPDPDVVIHDFRRTDVTGGGGATTLSTDVSGAGNLPLGPYDSPCPELASTDGSSTTEDEDADEWGEVPDLVSTDEESETEVRLLQIAESECQLSRGYIENLGRYLMR